jgi:hypothetical protein
MREINAWPQRQLEASLQLEERHGAVLVFATDNALRGKSEPITVEGDGALEVVHA